MLKITLIIFLCVISSNASAKTAAGLFSFLATKGVVCSPESEKVQNCRVNNIQLLEIRGPFRRSDTPFFVGQTQILIKIDSSLSKAGSGEAMKWINEYFDLSHLDIFRVLALSVKNNFSDSGELEWFETSKKKCAFITERHKRFYFCKVDQ